MRKIRGLIACECSGEIRDAFLNEGFDVMSCDIKPTRKPGPHYCGDVRDILSEQWDFLVAHPVCKYLTNAGVRWLHTEPGRWEKMVQGVEFFKLFDQSKHIPFRAVENPVMHGYALNLVGRRATQFIQPWWFGDPYQKATGWWLTGFPKLIATHKKTDYLEIKQECWLMTPSEEREELRSKTYPGHAKALAKQWGQFLREQLQ